MKNKFFLSLLTSVFLFSTTALPVPFHLCKMIEWISIEECVITAYNTECNSCLEKEKINDFTGIKSNGSCCSTRLVDEAVKDNFISTKFDNKNLNSIKLIASVILSKGLSGYSRTISFFYRMKSPQSQHTNKLYLLNSILLI